MRYNLFQIDQYADVVRQPLPSLEGELKAEMHRVVLLSYWFMEDLEEVETILSLIETIEDRKLQMVSEEYRHRVLWKRERL